MSLLHYTMTSFAATDRLKAVGWPDAEPQNELEMVLKLLAPQMFRTRRFCDVDAALVYALFANKMPRKDALVPASPSELQLTADEAFRISDLHRSCFAREDEDHFTRAKTFAEQVLKLSIAGLRSRMLKECIQRLVLLYFMNTLRNKSL
jgi:hypothetical protein